MHPQKCTLQVLIHISRSWLTLDVNLTYVSADFLLHIVVISLQMVLQRMKKLILICLHVWLWISGTILVRFAMSLKW